LWCEHQPLGGEGLIKISYQKNDNVGIISNACAATRCRVFTAVLRNYTNLEAHNAIKVAK
jgi:hypothetical protein